MGFEESQSLNVDYDINDHVEVINGSFMNQTGTIQEINYEKHKVKVLLTMFGRETPTELDFSQIKKVQ